MESTYSPEKIISLKQMANLLNRHEKTIYRMWAVDGTMPKPIMIKNKTLGWKESAYKAWLDSLES